MDKTVRVGLWLESQRERLWREAPSAEGAEALVASLGLEREGWSDEGGVQTLLARFPKGMPDERRLEILDEI